MRAGQDSGAQAGQFLFGSGSSYVFPTSGFPTVNTGILTAAIVWASGGGVSVSLNGGPLTSLGSVINAGVCTITCNASIGAGYTATPGSLPAPDVRVLALATWATAATSTQAQALTLPNGNRFALPSSVRSSAVVDWQASRDWNGSASTSTSLGTSPITLNVTGPPTLYSVAELAIATSSGLYRDGAIAMSNTDTSGVSYTIRDSYSHVVAQSDATYADAIAYSTLFKDDPAFSSAALWVNGSFNSAPLVGAQATPQGLSFAVAAGAGKTLDFWEGTQSLYGASLPLGPREGTFLQSIRIPTLALDGVTSTHTLVLGLAHPTHRVVLLGDSILTGFVTNPPIEYGPAALMRQSYTYPTDGITSHTAGDDSVGNEVGPTAVAGALVATLTAESDGTSSNVVWDQLSTNDYGFVPISASNFAAYLASLMDSYHTANPSARWVEQGATQRISPSTEAANSFGNTLGDYRAAKQAACAARSSYCTYVECAAGACVSNANIASDGLHLVNAGAAQFTAVIVSTLTAAGSCGATTCL
jgi:hypothetical protein